MSPPFHGNAQNLAGVDFHYLPVKPDRVERAIADDIAFLDAHPTRARKQSGES